ncbi:protein NEDD1 isoform X2 [Hippocampus comes]|uniref:protein NEDD1 isoform X2 n=1 Tax=Hippocampus comes TaxID=109280 RepID=UPI00094E6B1F|nr:PREDICTED: protein NEDD1 isoform X2 [Hippocampus comes]
MDDVTRLMSTGDTVKIWDADSMTLLEQFNPHSGSHPVAQACWMANNQHVVSASSSGDKVVVSSLKSPDIPLLELAQGKGQTRVSLSSSSQFVASGGLDRCVHIWDLKTSKLLRSLKDHGDEVTCVSFNANDSLLASGAADGHLVLYSLTTNTSSKPFGYGSQQPVRDLGLSCLKRSLLGSVSDGGWLTLWDANTQKELHAFRTAHKAPGSAVAFSPASELLVVSVGLDKKIVCYDTASKIIVRSIRAESPLTSVAFTPDGSGVLVGSTQGDILRYDLRNSSAPTRVTPAHATSVTCLRFQCATARHKLGKMSSSRVSGTKSSASKLCSGQLSPALNSSPHINAVGAQVASRDAGGQQGAEQFAVAEKFSSVGRNSLDMFSPLRQGDNTQPPTSAGETFGAAQATALSKEAGLPQICGRGSLEMFSPLREGQTADVAPRKPSAGRLLRPTSAYQTPTIKEEESTQVEMSDFSPSLEGEGQTLTSSSRPANCSHLVPPFTPELRVRASGVQAQLDYDSPAADAAAPAVTEAAGGAPAPFSGVLMNAITSIIHQSLDELRDACHRDIINLQVEMIRQFCIQQNEFQALMSAQHSANEALLQENQRLKEENLRLKTNY